jgi:hypothetical protein
VGSWAGLRRLREPRLLATLTAAGVAVAFLRPLLAFDLWWHIRAGELIVRTAAVPRVDPFSFTAAGLPWTYHSWLSGVVFWWVHEAAGDAGLVAVRAVAVCASLLIAWTAARRRGVDAGLASVLVLAAAFTLQTRGLVRPLLFSFLLFSVFAAILDACSRSAERPLHAVPLPLGETDYLWGAGGRLAALPVLMLLWANLHAGFVSGLLLLGAFGAGEFARLALAKNGRLVPTLLFGSRGARFRAMALVGAFCVACSLATPSGADALLYPIRLVGRVKLLRLVEEWQPTPVDARYAPFWFLVLLGFVGLAWRAVPAARRGRLRGPPDGLLTDALLWTGFAVLAARSQRHTVWVALLAPAVVGDHLVRPEDGVAGGASSRRGAYAIMALALCAVMVLLPVVGRASLEGDPRASRAPAAACDFIEANELYVRPYNSYEWGGYLIWRLWPRVRVFVDGRCLLYGDELLGQAVAVSRGDDGWQGILDRWDIGMLVLRYRAHPSRHFFDSGAWRCVYWDDWAIVAVGAHHPDPAVGRLPTFDSSNPVLLADTLDSADLRRALDELAAVLERDGACWTALSLRARCLARLADREPDGQRRREMLAQALAEARRAVELQSRRAGPWTALQEVGSAIGDRELAESAGRRAADCSMAYPEPG